MAKTLISRLDAENIVRAAVDPETHEATGDVYDSVNDVSYPFGGGGGEDDVLMLTVTLNNETDSSANISLIMNTSYTNVLENKGLYPAPSVSAIASGETSIYKYVYVYDESVTPYAVSVISSNTNVNVTDMVNCSYDNGDVIITDTTKSASLTIDYKDPLS